MPCFTAVNAGSTANAQYCLDKQPNAKGSYRETAHFLSRLNSNEKTTATQFLDAVVDAVKNVYPQPAGADIGPYGGIFSN